jgi:hypothetical protein
MLRIIYTLLMVALIGGTAWAATGYQPERPDKGSTGVGFVLIAALQRGAAS